MKHLSHKNIPVAWMLVFMLFYAADAYAQYTTLDPTKPLREYVQKKWGVEQGAPFGAVSYLLQTRDGYLWFCGEAGLMRFDGVKFTVYSSANSPLKSQNMYKLFEAQDGTIWIGTSTEGVFAYRNGKFTEHHDAQQLGGSSSVWAITQTRDGAMWFGTSGGGVQRLLNGTFTSYTTKNGLTNNNIRDILEGRDGTIWVASFGGGLNYLKNGIWSAFTKKDGLSDNTLTALCQDSTGGLWIGTNSRGIIRYANGVFTTFDEKDGLTITNSIYRLIYDQTGMLWITSENNGAARYFQGRFEVVTDLPDNVLRSAAQEHTTGALWFCTYSSGIVRLSSGLFTVFNKENGFQGRPTCVLETKDGKIWSGAIDGLYCYWQGAFQKFGKAEGLTNIVVYSFFEDTQKRLWVGTNSGLCMFDGKRFLIPSWWKPEADLPVLAMTEDNEGTLWIATYGSGLYSFNGKTLHHFTKENSQIPSNALRAVIADRNGGIWIGTNDAGISLFRSGTFTNYNTATTLNDASTHAFYQDSSGAIWVATRTQLLRLKNNKFIAFGAGLGILKCEVYSVLEDKAGSYWVASDKGVIHFTAQDITDYEQRKRTAKANERITLKYTLFSEPEGLRITGTDGGSQPAAWKARDGKLWFHTANSLAVLDPTKVRSDMAPPNIIIESAKADTLEMAYTTHFHELSATTRRLEFQFTIPEFSAPERIKFRYILEGYDKDWTDATRREAFYENLPRGRNYRFRVVGCNKDGVWNETGSQISFKLLPFWYETWWFYGVCATSMLAVGVVILRVRTAQLKRRAEDLEAQLQVRTAEVTQQKEVLQTQATELHRTNTQLQHNLDELKRTQSQLVQAEKMAALGTLVSGVAHELNTPIGVAVTAASTLQVRTRDFVKRFTEGGLKKSELEQYVQTAETGADMTLRNLERAANLVQSFKQVAVDQTRDDIRAFRLGVYLREIITSLQPMIKTTKHRIELNVPVEVEITNFPGALSQIITNLVQNAIKHAFEDFREDGTMKITVIAPTPQTPNAAMTNDQVTILFADDGAGITPEVLPRIFDPFFTTKPGKQGGTGLGLHISYNLATQKMGGAMRVESQEGAGTRFVITLPIHYTEGMSLQETA